VGERAAAPVSLVDFFDSFRALKREITGEPLSQADVDAFNAIITGWKAPQAAPDASGSASGTHPVSDSQSASGAPSGGLNPTALADGSKFFASIRSAFGALTQPQVDGFEALLQAFGEAMWPIAYAAYGLATARRETNATMEPVREAYWLSEDWRRTKLKYYPWYGRGFCQLTWQQNYAKADAALGLGGKLIANPDLALQSDIAAQIMVRGMSEGWFSGKRLADYLPASGAADIHEFTNARHIINGQDHAVEIAENALKFQDALLAGGWV
jgi:predicted chitinase